MYPQAKQDNLVIQEVADEVLVYDLSRHKAHSLNRTAALVWRYSDGETSPEAMAGKLKQELNLPADPQMVQFALERLDRAGLLDQGVARSRGERVTRRQLAQRLGTVGALAVLVPTVTSILAPSPAAAASCIPQADCTSATQAGRPCCETGTICADQGGGIFACNP